MKNYQEELNKIYKSINEEVKYIHSEPEEYLKSLQKQIELFIQKRELLQQVRKELDEWKESSPKFTMLHEKELVLNKDDTKNFLEAVKSGKYKSEIKFKLPQFSKENNADESLPYALKRIKELEHRIIDLEGLVKFLASRSDEMNDQISKLEDEVQNKTIYEDFLRFIQSKTSLNVKI